MVDEFVESKTEFKNKLPVETASAVITSPDHPKYSADRAVAQELLNGRTAIIAAIDGVGSGEEKSEQAAEIVQKRLLGLKSLIMAPPTVNQAVDILKREILQAGREIQELQSTSGNNDADTTVCTGIVCDSLDGKARFLTVANVGDSRIYKYSLLRGEITQLTRDQSLVQRLVDSGKISKEEAFNHPLRNLIDKTVGSIKSGDEIGFSLAEIEGGDVFLAVTDGVSDNLTPKGFPKTLREEFHESYDRSQGKVDLKKFSMGVAQCARNVMSSSSEHAKNDDITVAVLQVPRLVK